MEKSLIVFTGGGSGGHVVPAITLIESLKKDERFELQYIGSHDGIERELIAKTKINYKPIATGKLRRYLDFKNFTDIFRIFLGFFQALKFLSGLKHQQNKILVMSMGGFVAVPVVFAARMLGLKVMLHEQTSRVGLANKLCGYVARRVLLSFEKSRVYFAARKVAVVGYPLRDAIFSPVRNNIVINEIELNSKLQERPMLLATGGGNGSLVINNIIKNNFHWLNQRYCIVHQVGKNFFEEYSKLKNEWYFPVPFLGDEIIEMMKLSKVVLSRAGAGTVCELIALRKTSIFIPLKIAQKNEQYHNAIEAKEKIGSIVILEDDVEKTDWASIFVTVENANSKPFEQRDLGKNPRDLIIQEMQHLLEK